jgi:hypothetical protein
MKENLIVEILSKAIELLKSAISMIATLKNQSNNTAQQDKQKNSYARNAHRMYPPRETISDWQKKQQLEAYHSNNHKAHELGEKLSKHPNAEERRVYDNYSAERQLGKALNEERQARLHK